MVPVLGPPGRERAWVGGRQGPAMEPLIEVWARGSVSEALAQSASALAGSSAGAEACTQLRYIPVISYTRWGQLNVSLDAPPILTNNAYRRTAHAELQHD